MGSKTKTLLLSIGTYFIKKITEPLALQPSRENAVSWETTELGFDEIEA